MSHQEKKEEKKSAEILELLFIKGIEDEKSDEALQSISVLINSALDDLTIEQKQNIKKIIFRKIDAFFDEIRTKIEHEYSFDDLDALLKELRNFSKETLSRFNIIMEKFPKLSRFFEENLPGYGPQNMLFVRLRNNLYSLEPIIRDKLGK
jgi:hypothetical protein